MLTLYLTDGHIVSRLLEMWCIVIAVSDNNANLM